MRNGTEAPQLRPLGVGEILDRAVTIYVRHILLFMSISAFFAVPIGVVNYFAMQQSGGLAQILDQMGRGSTAAAAPAPPVSPWFFAVILIAFFLTPFMYVAMAAALGRIYSGQDVDWRGAYGVALRHAGAILMTALCQLLIVLTASFVGVLVLAAAFAAAVLLVRSALVLGIIAAIFAVGLATAFVLALVLCYLAIALAFDAIGIEEVGFTRALGSGFARVFNRAEIGKAVLVCLAFVAVELGLLVLSGVIGGIIEGVLHQALLQAVFAGLLSLITTGFVGVLLAVYYFDVRIRREGLDMQAAIDRLQPQS